MADDYDDYFNDQRQQALTSVVAPADEDDPEKAARAISLGSTTGVAPELIYPNVEEFEKQHQAVLNSDLITKNARLQGYLNSDPMAAKVSQDDIGHLDQVSELLHQFGYGDKPQNWLQTVRSYTHPQNFERGFWEGFGEQPVGQTARDYYDISHDPFGSLGWHLATDVPEIGLRSIQGLFHGIAEVAKTHVAATGNALGLDGETLSKDIAGMFEAEAMGMTGRHGMPSPEMQSLVRGATDRAMPYLENGKMPPTGVHPLIDSVYKAAAERDAGTLDELVKESAANATRERSPDYYAKFAEYQLPDGPKIKVDASAISRLYGDKPPEADDGILGWVPNLAERLETTAGAGGYIDVPLKDWLANIDSEVHKELRDDILVRDHGFTVNEAKEVQDWKPELPEKVEPAEGEEAKPLETPVDPARTLLGPTQVVRGAAGLEPLFSVGDRKVTLQRMGEATKQAGLPGAFHNFDLLDQDGKKIGALNLSEHKDGKQLYVEMIQAGADKRMYDPNFLGPALVRDIGRQLKQLFPNAFGPDGLGITGHRMSGAREKAGSWEAKSAMPVVKFDLGDPDSIQKFRDLLAPHWEQWTKNVEALKGGPIDEHQQAIHQAVMDEAARLGVTNVDTARAIHYEKAGGPVQGVFDPTTMRTLISLEADHPVGTLRHEAMHIFEDRFSPEEWSKLTEQAKADNWIKKFNIDERYANFNEAQKEREALSEGYRYWRAGKDITDGSGIFQKIADFFDRLHARIKEILGRDFDWEEVFKRVDSGEVGRREAPEEGVGEPLAQAGDEPEPQRITLPFGEGKAIGIRQDIYQRYMRLIRQKHEADLKADYGDAVAKETRTQSKEWREAAAGIRDQVEASVDERPNILVDRLLSERAGEFKIDPMSLREDLRDVLPKEYMRKTNSTSADELASYFGYPSGDALVEHLAQITEDRKATGLSHADYVKKLVNDETNRQMEAQFGFLEKNILEEAKDRALSDNQISIIEQEVLALAEQAKQSAPIDRGAILSKLREAFSDTPVGGISSEALLKASGKAGRETEEALLKGDYQEAFNAKQRQWLAVTQAKWALAYEKQRAQLDKTAKQWSKKEAHIKKEVAPEFVNHLQDQLRRAGYPGTRSLDNIHENLAGQSIAQFAEEHLAGSYGMRDLPVAEFAVDPTWHKPVDELTHEQFTQFKGMIDSLVKNGRDIYKFGKAGDKADLESAIADFREGIAQDYEGRLPEYGERPGVLRTFAASLTSMPTVFNLFDRLDRNGPWNGLARRFLDQDAEGVAFSKEVEKAWKEVSDYGDLSKKIAPPPMMPKWGERYGSFTRQNLLGLIQNAGNRSNWFKTARGWEVDPELAGWGDTKPGTLWSWMLENSEPADFARAQAMGDKIFSKVVKRTDMVEENVNGYTLDKLPLEAFEVDHGIVDQEGNKADPLALKGWYHPLIPDQIWYAEKGAKKGVYNDSPFGHIMTSNGYTRTRTGAIYPVDLGYGMLPARIGQMIHDITHRELVLDAQKVMLDPRVKNDITKYWGKEYTDLMEPYLREIAGQAQMPSANMARMEAASEFLRQNTMTTYIGYNPSTPMKHFPTAFFQSLRDGKGMFLKAYMQQWMGLRPNEGNYWGQYAMDHSEVLQGRDRHWREALGNNLDFPKADFGFTNWRDWRNESSRWGSKIVAWSDMASAKALWIGQYQRYLGEGINAADSISRANQDVVRQHGALLLSNKPERVRQSGNLHGWMTSVYGFMGERFQRLREAGFRINDTWDLMEKGELEKASKNLPAIAADYLTYVVQVGLWEQAAQWTLSGEHRAAGMRLFDLAFGNIASSIIYARDIWHAAETGQDPGTGLLTSAAADLNRVVKDLFRGKDAINKQHAGQTLRDIVTMGGITTGITPRQFGNVVKFPMDVYNRQQYPKDVGDWFRGLAKGQMPKKETHK